MIRPGVVGAEVLPNAGVGGCSCAVCASSRPDPRGPRVLAATTPVADESLIGLVTTAMASNHLSRTVALTRLFSSKDHAFRNLALRDDVDFAQLAFAARLDPHEVEARRYPAIRISAAVPGVRFHGATVPLYDLRMNVRRGTPSSFKPGGRHSALGHHGLMTHCPVTREPLIDRCGRCSTTLSWTRTERTRCSTCGDLLGHTVVELISPEEARASALMVDLIHPCPVRNSAAAASLPSELTGVDRGVVFELGWRLGALLSGIGAGDRDRAKYLPPETRLRIMREGSSALAAWPRSVDGTIAEKAERHGHDAARAFAKDVRGLSTASNAWPQHGPLLQGSAVVRGRSSSAAVKRAIGGVNAQEAEDALGVGQRAVQRLRRATRLVPVIASGEINSFEIFAPGDIAALKPLLADRIPLGTVAQELGISRHGVEQLCCMDLLDEVHPSVAAASNVRQVGRASFKALLSDLAPSLPTEPACGMLLHRAVVTFGGRAKPWGPIIAAMIAGDLPFHLLTGDQPFASRAVLPSEVVPMLRDLVFQAADHPGRTFEQRMTGDDAAETLNLNWKTFREAQREGVIRRLPDRSFDVEHVLDLARIHISGGEVLMRWMGGGKRLPEPLRHPSGPERLNSLGYSRLQVETAMRGEPAFHGKRERMAGKGLPTSVGILAPRPAAIHRSSIRARGADQAIKKGLTGD